MKKKTAAFGMALMTMVLGTNIMTFAGSWKNDSRGYWWQNDDGSYPVNCWQWLDGNQDGISECYYFDGNGYMLANTITPDGYQVKGDGAWTVDGTVQIKGTNVVALKGTYKLNLDKTQTENHTSIQMMFGSGIKYGHEMKLEEDGKITWYIGIGNGGEGTYTYNGSNGEISYIDYEEGNFRRIEFYVIREQGTEYMVMDYNGYKLYWER